MKFTNTKKIASSALAILLCASMILSFSLSVYAANEASKVLCSGPAYNTFSAMGSILRNSSYRFTATTHAISGIPELYRMSVYITVYDGNPYEDYDVEFNLDGNATIRDVSVTVTSNTSAISATGVHYIEDVNGYFDEQTTIANIG